jgi:hypothetical protein
MPYELSFTKAVTVTDREQYINDCCIGGDFVVDHLRPAIEQRYGKVDSGQEDWGWFIWFRDGPVGLAIDVFTDDADAGAFRIMLTARKKRLVIFNNVVDTPELETLRERVVGMLEAWTERPVLVEHAKIDG